jgi:hypothetical protein
MANIVYNGGACFKSNYLSQMSYVKYNTKLQKFEKTDIVPFKNTY